MSLIGALLGARPGPGIVFVGRHEREVRVGWHELASRAAAMAVGLRRLGIAPGDRVALVFPTGPAFFHAFFGCWLAGAVPVPLYPPVRLGRLEEYHRRTAAMLRASGAQAVLSEGAVSRLLGEAVSRGGVPLGLRTPSSLSTGGEGLEVVDATALGLVQFSSGTTGDPKPVALTHEALFAQADLVRQALLQHVPEHEVGEHRGVSWLPLYHDMGLIGAVLPALIHQRDLVLLGPEVFVGRPASWLRALSRHRGTITVAPNFAYGLCTARIRDDELDGCDLSGVRVAMNGAEPVAPDTLRAFVRRFGRWGFRADALAPVYGLSEAALAVTCTPFGSGFQSERFDRAALGQGKVAVASDGRELVSVGLPLPGFEVRILDGDGRASGGVGRVWVRGPSLMEGYLGRPEATAEVLVGGWLDTGDLGFRWNGHLYLTGRHKDMLLVRGRNHAPQDVEQAVDRVAGVRTGCAAVVSHLPEGREVEEVVVFVEHARQASRAEIDALPSAVDVVAREVAGLAVDRVVVLAPGTLPRTSSGKVRRQETLARWLTGALTPPEEPGVLGLAGAMVRSQVALWRRPSAT